MDRLCRVRQMGHVPVCYNDAAKRGVKNAQRVALSSKSESTRDCNMLVTCYKHAEILMS